MSHTPETTLQCSPWPFLAPPQAKDEIGRLAQYRVLKLLGRGGMGMVFQAEDTQLRRPVALKVMLPEVAAQEQSSERFLREARAAAALKHDHVVTIYQVGQDRGVPFLAMELLKGKSLADWLASGRQASVTETLIIGRQVAKALAAAHQTGLIHRDIKPANLWLEAPAGRVKVLDFGLARWADGQFDQGRSQMTAEGAIVGTPAFMAPEQARGEEVTAKSDLFSLGCVLYRLATGRAPFSGDTAVAVLSAVLTQPPRPVRELNAQVPERLATLIERLLAKWPSERPASAQAVLDELVEIHEERKASADTATLERSGTIHLGPGTSGPMAATSGAGPRRLGKWLLAAVLLGGGIAVATMVFLFSGGWESRSQPAANSASHESSLEQPPAEPPPQEPALAEPVDLLALIDLNRDTRAGKWGQRSSGVVTVGERGDGSRFGLDIPWNPPEEYRLRLVVEQRARNTNLGVGLAQGASRFNLIIDADQGGKFLTGLGSIDGRGLSERRDAWIGEVLSRGIPIELVVTVRKNHVSLTAAEKLIYYREVDLSKSTRPPLQPQTPLSLFGNGPGGINFHKIMLEPLAHDRGAPPGEEAKGLAD